MTGPTTRQRLPIFAAVMAVVLASFHGVYTLRGVPAPQAGFRTFFAEAGYVLRYMAGQTPALVIASRREGKVHLFHRGELEMQEHEPAVSAARTLTEAARSAIDLLSVHGVVVIPVIVPTKLSLYREQLPYRIELGGRWSHATDEPQEDPQFVHRAIAETLPEAIDLYEPFREFRRANPARLLYPPLDYHWTSLGSALAVETIARQLMARGLLSSPPRWIDEGRRPFSTSYLTDQYPLPRWFVDRAPEFHGEEDVVRFAHNTVSEKGRVILIGTSFSGGSPQGFLGQLRSVMGREMVEFVRPDNGYSGGFRMMTERRFLPEAGDIVVWEIPLCCLNLEGPRIPDALGY